jgi:hypothetical protein
MATTNRIVIDQAWDAEALRDFKHFKGIVEHQGLYDDITEAEIREAYQLITGKEPPGEKKQTSKK